MEPSAPSPEYLDAVDVLKEQEQQIRELQNEIKSKEEQLDEKESHWKSMQLQLTRRWLKTKNWSWTYED